MSGDKPGFLEVVQDTDPSHEGHDEIPRVEVREQTRESRRHRRVGRSEPRTQYRFYVVDNHAGEVVFRGRWTTDGHHNPYGEAKARAFGFASGYKAALDGE
jgi:hypothetical protein